MDALDTLLASNMTTADLTVAALAFFADGGDYPPSLYYLVASYAANPEQASRTLLVLRRANFKGNPPPIPAAAFLYV